MLRVRLCEMSRHIEANDNTERPTQSEGTRTKSSPTGPAEQEDGGSLKTHS